MTRPDILWIITDHQAWYGHFVGPDGLPGGIAPVRLPVWERFCAAGARFAQASAVCPLCTPARSSMMTGLVPVAHGLRRNTDGGGDHDLRSGTTLYSHGLTRAGYRNGYVGKWHCGRERLPVDYGIQGWSLPDYGRIYSSDRYRSHARRLGLGPPRARIERSMDHPEWDGSVQDLDYEGTPWLKMNNAGVLLGDRAGHEADAVAALAADELRDLAAGSQPFSLVASFWAPHQPYFPSAPFAGMVDPSTIPEHPSHRDSLRGKPARWILHRRLHHAGVAAMRGWADWQPVVARCYEQCLQTDAAVGAILDALERSGRAGNTLVVWCADHGDALGGHGGLWDKGATMSEEVMRIPLAVRWPGHIAPGTVVADPVSNLDVPATLLEAAGCPIPEHWHSRSLLGPAQRGERRDGLVCYHHGHGTIVEQRMLRLGRWKYVAALYDGDELYDLAADPWELSNRIGDPACAGVLAECRARLRASIAAEPRSGEGQRLAIMLEDAGLTAP